jgi:hypothetical protein
VIEARPLGRKVPTDWKHADKYPLTGVMVKVKRVPVTIGVNWYAAFDTPVKSGSRFLIGKDPKALGKVRGGHCVTIPDDPAHDLASWWDFYDQGSEGACVGFGSSRMMSLLNRKRYDARWLWNEAKKIDEWTDTNPGDDNGTSVRAAMDVLRGSGHVPAGKKAPSVSEGISVNRWATKVSEILDVLGNPLYAKLGMVPILNSWGRGFPHVTWMPLETLQRLLDEDGEATMVTDR